jgi:hypothetical protein
MILIKTSKITGEKKEEMSCRCLFSIDYPFSSSISKYFSMVTMFQSLKENN